MRRLALALLLTLLLATGCSGGAGAVAEGSAHTGLDKPTCINPAEYLNHDKADDCKRSWVIKVGVSLMLATEERSPWVLGIRTLLWLQPVLERWAEEP